jgi:hypothetical protein
VSFRSVREEPPFWQSMDRITSDTKRFDDLYFAAQIQIACASESCPLVSGPMRMARAQEIPGGPVLRVLFTINSPTLCSVWHADFVPDPGFEEEDTS